MPRAQDSDDLPHDPAAPLFAVPPAAFVAARNQLALDLRKAGKKSEAAAVKALPKPSTTVWAVNQLAKQAPAALQRFFEISDDVWRAQSAGAGNEDARRAYHSSLAAQREALDPLVEHAAALCADHDINATRAVLDGIANNLRYGAFDETARGQLLVGRLSKDLAPPDFAALVNRIPLGDRPSPGVAAKSSARQTRIVVPAHVRPSNDSAANRRASDAGDADDVAERAEREAGVKQRTEARQRAQAIKTELRPLEAQAQRTRTKVASLAQKQDRAEAAIEDLRRQLTRTETEARAAKDAHAAAAEELGREEGRLSELRAALAQAEAAAKPRT